MSYSVRSCLGILVVIAAVVFGPSTESRAQTTALDEIVVTATLRRGAPSDIPASVTVLDAATLRAAGISHLQDVLPLIPNLNWASGTSRPRYFQLRGIGETDQWQGAPNPSVGFLIDGMDFSGIGMPATLIDLGQIEVLRGPQGAALGANALAGLINVQTAAPTSAPHQRLEFTGGEAGTAAIAAVWGGPWGETDSGSAWRLTLQRHRSDGWRRNVFLERNDTNGLDERTARMRFDFGLGEHWRADVSALLVDLDNGFDAFALDNSRRTRSDDPGRDRQRSRGLSLTLERPGDLSIRSVTAVVDADIVYAFDGDWGSDPGYDFTSRFLRSRQTLSQDWRIGSADEAAEDDPWRWLAGAYGLRVREANDQLDLYAGDVYRALVSDYRADTLAAYGLLERRLGTAWRASLGARLERRATRYRDTDGTDVSPGETLHGGHVSLQYSAAPALQGYLTLSLGYKGGGFNLGTVIPQDRRQFNSERLENLEFGLKFRTLDGDLQGDLAVFSMRRRDQQVSTSAQLDPGDPLSFIYLTDNAARGRNVGVELSWQHVLREGWRWGGSAGRLRARFDAYRSADRELAGRAQAHAPSHQIHTFLERRVDRGLFLRVDLQRVAAFYFSDSHDERSQPYTLVNLKTGWASGAWRFEAWVRNVLDESYAQRGFFFGNEPPEFPNRLYVQLADPRAAGVTISWQRP